MFHHPQRRPSVSSSPSAGRRTIALLPASSSWVSADPPTISPPMRQQQQRQWHQRFGQQPMLPPEIWAHIFQEATAIHNFFDTRWDSCRNSIVTPFDEASFLASSPTSPYYSSSSSSYYTYCSNTSSASPAPATFATSLRE
jgi:hypothetical protein